jgi:endonuclease/exonuclease/phosphatase family metal-dependent hydrolase
MTFNVNFGLGGDPSTVDALLAGEADVIFLQETTPAWERGLRTRLNGTHPHQRWWHVRGGAGGMAVLSRWPFESTPIPSGPGWFDALRIQAESPLGPLEVLAVHLRPPVSDSGSFVSGYFSTPAIRHAEILHHTAHLRGQAPLLVVGDFNEDEDGRAVEALSDTYGLRNALMLFAPGADTWRWSTWAGEINSTLDHILFDARLTCLDAEVIEAGRSDHLPVVATFVRARKGGVEPRTGLSR